MKPDTFIDRHVFLFNPQDNGGESLVLTTDIIANGDPGVVFTNQELTLQSYCNGASFDLVGAPLTPENLRRLANELDEVLAKARAKANG